jgi:hypothetical protein
MSPAFPWFAFIAMLFLPWPDGGSQPFFKAVATTILDLNRNALAALERFDTFQTDINTPNSGEQVLGTRVQEMLAMLRGHGVEQYRLSDSIAADAWVTQQIVATAWPRKLERDARAVFVLAAETPSPGCIVMDKQREVTLVYCP